MIIYLSSNQAMPIDAVAVRGCASIGQGSNAVSYQAKTADGRWHCFVKGHNPHLKIKISKDAIKWERYGVRAFGCSDEMPV